MATSKIVNVGRSVVKQVKPVLSLDKNEAKRRVFNLYKMWYRHIPQMVKDFELPVTVKMAKIKMKEEFLKKKDVKDLRAIDILVIKGQQDLIETMQMWKQSHHLMKYFEDTIKPKTDFMSRFYEGHD